MESFIKSIGKRINVSSSILGALPLSPLHVKALADTEERVEQGHIQSVYESMKSICFIKDDLLFGLELFKYEKPV